MIKCYTAQFAQGAAVRGAKGRRKGGCREKHHQGHGKRPALRAYAAHLQKRRRAGCVIDQTVLVNAHSSQNRQIGGACPGRQQRRCVECPAVRPSLSLPATRYQTARIVDIAVQRLVAPAVGRARAGGEGGGRTVPNALASQPQQRSSTLHRHQDASG